MSENLSAFYCTPRQVRKFTIRCMQSGLVPFIESSPAMGKSALIASIAREYNLKLIDHRMSTSAPEDMSGLPDLKDDKAVFKPFDVFPIESDSLPLWEGETEPKFNDAGECINCYSGWFLFLDEFNSATKMVQAAAYKLVLDKMVGQNRLHPNVVIACAGNMATDRAIVNSVGTALQSRMVWLTMTLDLGEFLEDVAFPQKWDSRIVAYLNYKPSALHDFRPDHNDKTFCAPRTWEFMNKLVRGHDVVVEDAPLYAGTITSGVATDFIQFTRVFDDLPKIKEIEKDPEGTKLPSDSASRYATISHLTEVVTEENFPAVATYINRFGADFRILFFRGIRIQKPALCKHKAFRESMASLSRYLNDDDIAAAA